MSVRKIINFLEERKQRIISIQDSVINIYNKYKKHKDFVIDNISLISFKTSLATNEVKITNKLLNKAICFLTLSIKLQEEFEESHIICSISFGDKEFPGDYYVKAYGNNILIEFKTNEKPEKLINAMEYFIGEMQNYVSNINISKDKYVNIFSNVCAQSRFSLNTRIKYNLEFEKHINANNFNILTIDNLGKYIDFIAGIKSIDKDTLWIFLNTIIFSNINKITEEKFNLKG